MTTKMNGILLDRVAKLYFDEVLDEIDEEIHQALDTFIAKDRLIVLIAEIKDKVSIEVTDIILQDYNENMNSVQKLILGEKVSRIVSSELKAKLLTLNEDIMKSSFDLIDEIRNEIIGEVFETM